MDQRSGGRQCFGGQRRTHDQSHIQAAKGLSHLFWRRFTSRTGENDKSFGNGGSCIGIADRETAIAGMKSIPRLLQQLLSLRPQFAVSSVLPSCPSHSIEEADCATGEALIVT